MSNTINDTTEIKTTPQMIDIKLFLMRCEKLENNSEKDKSSTNRKNSYSRNVCPSVKSPMLLANIIIDCIGA